MAGFANRTTVAVGKSKAEIEQILARYGATRFAAGWDADQAVILFEAHGRRLRFNLPMPDRTKLRVVKGRRRTDRQVQADFEAEERRRWRCLCLTIKAKLEAVQTGIVSFESEFLSHIILPGGETVGEWTGPRLNEALDGKPLPPLLGMG